MIRMIRMIIQAWAPEMGSRDSPVERRGGRRPPRRPEVLITLQIPLLLRSARIPSPLSEISHKVPRARLLVFLRKCQWLAQYCAPDCSHSHIVSVGRSRIILWIILLAFQAYLKTCVHKRAGPRQDKCSKEQCIHGCTPHENDSILRLQ